ncbi:vWA domain-containing protein [Corynebacterium sp. sy039]|uniref:vWA domain-containing protein n=1 Tax=Corynebacterium sp. sy039 TaxID=2599641 RepID=UPI0011B38ADE|nr:vWA domain-containing protein [Corynebacterium sp. sy039]QDZ43198.1 VWA domain-containing protein [Corynebacterium sp. sy039]
MTQRKEVKTQQGNKEYTVGIAGRKLKKIGASVIAGALAFGCSLATLGLGSASAQAQQAPQAQPAEQQESSAMSDFAACMAGSQRGDLLIVMDQSASLVDEFDGIPATDPKALRVDAASDFVKELARYGQETGVDIRVRTAGFGEGYYNDEPNYGSWSALSDDRGVGEVVGQLKKFQERTKDNFTQYPDAFQGALATAGASDAPCRAVMIFSDGKMTMKDQDADAARTDLCAAQGPVAALRRSGIHIFSVGLTAGGRQDMSLLKDISESDMQCGNGETANGQFFAGADAAGLMAAFRSALPAGGSYSRAGMNINEPFEFVLDNSVSPIRLSGLPEKDLNVPADKAPIPYLIAPGGQPVELQPGQSTIGSATVTTQFNESVPGMVDVYMERTGDWAGQWVFGYRAPDIADATYRAQMLIRPGLKIAVDGAGENTLSHLNAEPLSVALVDSSGEPVALDGDATLSAVLENIDGTETPLAHDISIKDGAFVEVPLEAITQPTSGVVKLRADITTAASGDKPGTKLAPITYETPVSITLESLPSLPGTIDLGQITEKEHTVEVPVSGPGKIWLEDTIMLGDPTLPRGLDPADFAVETEHSSADRALVLERGEQATFPLTIRSQELADGPVSGYLTVHFSDEQGNDAGETTIPVRGAMSAPVNAVTFTAVMFVVLVAALAIPLLILYLMKYVAGKMPSKPRVYAYRVPITQKGAGIYRADTGQPFNIDYAELISQNAYSLDSRSASAAGYQLNVVLGLNPFTPAHVVVNDPLSIADDGAQRNNQAQLPLAVHNHWFLTMNPNNEEDITLVMLADENIQDAYLADIVASINAKAVERIGALRQSRLSVLENTTAKPNPKQTRRAGRGAKKAGNTGNAVQSTPQQASAGVAGQQGFSSDSSPAFDASQGFNPDGGFNPGGGFTAQGFNPQAETPVGGFGQGGFGADNSAQWANPGQGAFDTPKTQNEDEPPSFGN